MAAPLSEYSGVVSIVSGAFRYRPDAGWKYAYNSYPSTLTMRDNELLFEWESTISDTNLIELRTVPDVDIEIQMSFGDRVGTFPISFTNFKFTPYFLVYESDPSFLPTQEQFRMNGTAELLIDNVVVDSTEVSDGRFPAFSYSGNISGYATLHFRFSNYWTGYVNTNGASIAEAFSVSFDSLTIEGSPGDITDSDISISIKNIETDIEEIRVTVSDIQEGVTQIQDTVKDTHDQLEDPDSNIWQAAGSAISGAIESLFVPSEQDIANVKQGFDDLAQDKLGGAYTAMETVEDTITQVNDKLNNPSAAEGVEFPGIAVPLGGDVGTVVLAERQMVTLPMELTAILHPLGGTIISIIAGLGTFNVLKDMVECFLSGFSYAEYLHRNKGGSDE